MKKLSLLALLLLTGCYATADQMFLPDGTAGYRISCDHYLGEAADCIQKAGDLCGTNGYQMYDASGHLKNEDSQNQAVIATINSNTNANPAAKSVKMTEAPKNMFIKCRSMDAPLRLTPAANPGPVESTPPTDTKPMSLHNSNINSSSTH